MKIGIDIDDVITDTSMAMKKYIDKYDNNSDIHTHIEEVMRGEMSIQEIKDFFTENGVRIDIWTHFMRECIINYVH